MKVLWSYKEEKFGLPDCIPDAILSERRAQRNHGQTLERLNERGGLSVDEIVCNLLDISCQAREVMSLDLCAKYLLKHLKYKEDN
jgi:hypothetical protein